MCTFYFSLHIGKKEKYFFKTMRKNGKVQNSTYVGKNHYVRDDVIDNFSGRSEKFLVSEKIAPATFKRA